MGSTPDHWDAAYDQGDTSRGWYQPEARMSMALLQGVSHDASILDVGGGASVLVDDLLHDGYRDITVLDHSPIGLEIAQRRLVSQAEQVTWIVADLLAWQPDRTYDVWHDRAVLHFLLDSADTDRYVDVMTRATHVGSVVVIGVFGPEGPTMCAGLPVRRYEVRDMQRFLGEGFEIMVTLFDDHVRPDGDLQQYLWITALRRT